MNHEISEFVNLMTRGKRNVKKDKSVSKKKKTFFINILAVFAERKDIRRKIA